MYRNKLNKLRATKRSISDIVIDSLTVKVIESNNETTYTMAIVSENTNYYENLIIQQTTSDSIRAFIATYPITSEIVYLPEHNSYSYNSTPTFEQIDLDNSSQNKMHLVCYYVYLCDWEGKIHPATEQCNHVYSELNCYNTGGDGGGGMADSEPSIGHSNEETGGGGSSTGNTGSDSPTQEVINPPVHTSPVVVPSENVEDLVSTPCNKLKSLFDSTKTNIKPIVTALHKAIPNSGSGEMGEALIKFPSGAYSNDVQNQTPSNAIPMPTGGNYYSGIHTHPLDTYPMFSFSDIFNLYNLDLNIASHNIGMASFLLACIDDNGVPQTYAIVFDPNNLNTFDNFLSNPENIGCTEQEIKDKMDNKLGEDFYNDSNYERVLRKIIANTNVTLYKADTALTNWSKLSLSNKTPISTVKPTNCN